MFGQITGPYGDKLVFYAWKDTIKHSLSVALICSNDRSNVVNFATTCLKLPREASVTLINVVNTEIFLFSCDYFNQLKNRHILFFFYIKELHTFDISSMASLYGGLIAGLQWPFTYYRQNNLTKTIPLFPTSHSSMLQLEFCAFRTNILVLSVNCDSTVGQVVYL